ncbi:MAG: isoprenylcysteine carboxylmethyltransferase family protein [Chloroflexi bacterium]|nr:MAG: isoprenylcysteine carboxylmethyltransferase family protein [Chloroflexota bacterium]
MPPLYASQSVTAALFWTTYTVWYLLEMVTFFRLRAPKGVTNRDRGSRTALLSGLWSGVFVGFAAAFAAPFATITAYRNALFYFGIALMVTGVVIRQYAIAVLGRYHTMDVTTRQDQPLVEAGPYRWVRHPSYSGAFLTVIGILLCSTNWLSLTGLALMAAGYGYRIWVEERALAAHLGQPYLDYMRRTKRLVPFVL